LRIENNHIAEHLGSVKIHGVRRVIELDSGARPSSITPSGVESQVVERSAIEAVEPKLAIILPVKNEDLKVFEGVLSGVPHDCLIIVVSNSRRDDIDFFKSEQDILTRFCQVTQRQAVIVHQKDPYLARAIEEAGYPELLDDDGFIHNGKSEGMLTGLLLAGMLGKEYVGFIDSDNFIPGAVQEYAKIYAIGFSLSSSPYSMVRIQWRYKPKMLGELYFKKWGRVTEITNKYLNHFLSTKGRFETDIIKTGNAGEHAMSLDLAMRLTYASGYGVETQELISIFEEFGITPLTDRAVAEKGVEIMQTETINPHLHEERGDSDHLYQDMLLPSLAVIYHSPVCEDSTRTLIKNQLVELGCIKAEEEVPRMRLMPPPQKADLSVLSGLLEDHLAEITIPRAWPLSNRVTPRRTVTEAKNVVYTDLDGTLLHGLSYSYAPALQAIRLLQEKKIPLVFCSAKTFSEQEAIREELGISDPFIVENGGAVYIPKKYFRFPFTYDKAYEGYYIIELGSPYKEIRQRLQVLAANLGSQFTTFGDLPLEDISRLTGLSLRLAQMAKSRQYSETMVIQGGRQIVEQVLAGVSKEGLHCTFGGRFFEVSLGSDKGKAVRILNELFKLNFGQIVTFAVGDSENDQPMLEAVDNPLLVQNNEGHWKGIKIKKLTKVKGIGPDGFNRAVGEHILKTSD
jgi:mannosyl-3-phosphoglycerate synthase